MTKKRITEKLGQAVDLNDEADGRTLAEFIEWLTNLSTEFQQYKTVKFRYDRYGCDLYGSRYETDKELTDRLTKKKKAAENKSIRLAKQQAAKDARDRKIYDQLKKKFGEENDS